jgi:hypothetical protein
MTPSDWIGLGSLSAVVIGSVMARLETRFNRVEATLKERINDVEEYVEKVDLRVSKQEENTGKIAIDVAKLKGRLGVEDSTDPSSPAHVSPFRKAAV